MQALPKPIDIVRCRTWTNETVAELFHLGRLGEDAQEKKNIEQLAQQFYPPKTHEEREALIEIANDAYTYLINERDLQAMFTSTA